MERLTVHHLIPRQKNGHYGPKLNICSACHQQIHNLFDNTRLAQELNTLEKLRSEPQMWKFLCWVRKQDPNKRIKIDKKKA